MAITLEKIIHFLLEAPIAEEFTARFIEAMKRLVVGDPLRVRPSLFGARLLAARGSPP